MGQPQSKPLQSWDIHKDKIESKFQMFRPQTHLNGTVYIYRMIPVCILKNKQSIDSLNLDMSHPDYITLNAPKHLFKWNYTRPDKVEVDKDFYLSFSIVTYELLRQCKHEWADRLLVNSIVNKRCSWLDLELSSSHARPCPRTQMDKTLLNKVFMLDKRDQPFMNI